MRAFERALAAHCKREFANYAEWHEYSTAHPGEFWKFYLHYANLPVQGADAAVPLSGGEELWQKKWFDGAQVNYAQALLHPPAAEGGQHFTRPLRAGAERSEAGGVGGAAAASNLAPQPAIIAIREDGSERHLTYADLRAQVAACAAALTAAGVRKGDRVAAVLGNVPEAVILLAACAAIGAVFSSCSPDFGEHAAAARFAQIKPKLLFAQPAYRYQGNRYDITPMLQKLAAQTVGTAERVIFIPDEEDAIAAALPPAQQWRHWLAQGEGAPLTFAPLPFDHPLYILYSSGTTGLPKAIVHRTGGVMLKHHSEHHLHSDIRPGDAVLYFTTCGWMMWNWLVSALMQAATIFLYEGSPAQPGLEVLWQLAERHRLTFFGTSARFIQSCKSAGISPRRVADLSALRTIASTGSPLSPAGFEWVYEEVKADVHLASISGGTDIVGCFMLGNPTLPVHAGQIQVPAAGVDVAAFGADGKPQQGEVGELVSRVPFPSMPLKFWGDDAHEKYRAAYFSHYPGVWRHGDLITIADGGGIIVHGRSDATLNPGGVRIGSADITRPLEQIPAIADAAAIGKKTAEQDEEIWLFVVLNGAAELDDALQRQIKDAIRTAASPRHVPRRIFRVSQLPRTRSGKTTELAIADVINGREVTNRSVMANPEALEEVAAATSLPAP